MAAIAKGMSSEGAWQVLEKSNLTTPALLETKNYLLGKQTSLRKAPPKGYAGLDSAGDEGGHAAEGHGEAAPEGGRRGR